jgi:hypothetical protein
MDTLTQPLLRQFDDFLLDLRIRVLFRLNGGSAPEPVPLGSRACDVLCLLVEHHGAIVPGRLLSIRFGRTSPWRKTT